VVHKFLRDHRAKREDYENCAKIEPLLRRTIGPRLKVMETLKFSSDPSARSLLDKYLAIPPTVRCQLPIEAICLAARVDPTQILGCLILAARDASRAESALKTAMEHPAVIDSTVRSAKLIGPDGVKDREMMHKAVGWLPTPKGSVYNFNMGNKQASEEDDDSPPTDIDQVFGHDPKEIEDWSDNRRKLLEAPKRVLEADR
jgi:hypothetical protein